MKIAVYGTGREAEIFNFWMSNHIADIDVVYYVESVPSKETFKNKKVKAYSEINFNDFDYLVIAIVAYHEIIDFLKEKLPNYESVKSSIIYSHDFWELSSLKKYRLASTDEELYYIFDRNDMCIGNPMIDTGRTFSCELIEKFFELSKVYGNGNRGGGNDGNRHFLDIGANIGTTSIYVKKIIDPSLKIISFEPCKRNYDMLRVNCILNNVEDIKCVNLALGSKDDWEKFYYYTISPGSSGIDVKSEWIHYSEDVHVVALDDYLKNNGISPDDIDYIWIDVEGYESEVIKGAMKTLTDKKIPLIQEFNPSKYSDWEEYEKNIGSVYDNFIVVDENAAITEKTDIRPVARLKDYADSMKARDISYSDLYFF